MIMKPAPIVFPYICLYFRTAINFKEQAIPVFHFLP